MFKKISILLVLVVCTCAAISKDSTCAVSKSVYATYNTMDTSYAQSATVYICTGPKSLRYHKTSHCRGLSSCSGTIRSVSVDDAKKMGRTPCKICYH